MEAHEYINLPIIEIEQYSLVIPLNELATYQNKGWKTYHEIGLPKGEEEAWMLYGDWDKDKEILIFSKPDAIFEINSDRLIGRKITAIKKNIGTYGMGGPGYFGLLLDNEEYLVYTVSVAKHYVSIVNEEKVMNTTIKDYHLNTNSLEIILDNDEKIKFKFEVSYVFDEDYEGGKPNDIAYYLYFKLKESNLIVR